MPECEDFPTLYLKSCEHLPESQCLVEIAAACGENLHVFSGSIRPIAAAEQLPTPISENRVKPGVKAAPFVKAVKGPISIEKGFL